MPHTGNKQPGCHRGQRIAGFPFFVIVATKAFAGSAVNLFSHLAKS